MISAIIGDYIGSFFESRSIETYNLIELINPSSCFTDESVMVSATCDALLNGIPFAEAYLKWGNKYPNVSYGGGTKLWLDADDVNFLHNGFGNLAASRSAPIGLLDYPLSYLLSLAEDSAKCSHNSKEGIDGAKAVVYTINAVLNNRSRLEIYTYLYAEFDYLMDFYTAEQIKSTNEIDSSAFNTVPIAIWIALKSTSYDDAIRSCLYLYGRGDIDSVMSICGSIAGALHGEVDKKLELQTKRYLFKEAHDILFIINAFDHQKDICGLPF